MEVEKYINTNIAEKKLSKLELIKKVRDLFFGRVDVMTYETDNYTKCTDYYVLHLKAEINDPTPLELACHGLIFNLQNKLVCWNMPFLLFADDKITGKVNELITNGIELWKELYDGTMMRLFYDNNQWILSTNKQVDANIAKWNIDTSFADLFKKYLGGDKKIKAEERYKTLCDSLNKKYNYFFVIHSRETCKYYKSKIKPKVVHVETYDIEKNEVLNISSDKITSFNKESGMIGLADEKMYVFVEKPNIYKKESTEHLIKKYNSGDLFGIVGILYLNNIIHGYKLINNEVWKKMEFMSNNPNIEYNIISNICEKKEKEFVKIYPEYKKLTDDIMKKIDRTSKKIYDIYVDCFVINRHNKSLKGKIGVWCKPVIFKLHDYYCNGNGKVTSDVAKEILLSMKAPNVATVIGTYF